MMKIAMLTPDYYPNVYAGVGIHVHSLVKELRKYNDIEISVFVVRCEKKIGKSPLITEEGNVTIYEFVSSDSVNANSLDYFTYRWTENNIIALKYIADNVKKRFDILHCHDMFPIWVMDYFRRKLNIPVIASIHARATDVYKIENALRGHLFHTADAVISVSNALKIELVERFGNRDNIYTIYNGVSKSIVDVINSKKKQYITYCGRLTSTKGVDTLIKAYSLLKKRNINDKTKLLIMGDGELKEELKRLVEKEEMTNSIEFLGSIKNSIAREIINKALIHVVPSVYEPFATSALEAMEEGTTVIASNVGGLKEMIVHEENGLLFESSNYLELADKLEQALLNKTLLEKLEKNGKVCVKQYYWDNIASKTLEVYKSVLI